MAAIERIDSLYDLSAISKENEAVAAQLRGIISAMMEVQKGITLVGNAKGGSGLASSTDQLTKAQLELQKQTILTEKVLQAKQKTEQESIKTTQLQDKALQSQQKSQDKANAESKKAAKELENNQKAAEKLDSAYNQLNARAKIATTIANEMGARYGTTSEEFKSASERAKAMNAELYAIDSASGKYTRNVGNYSSALTGYANVLRSLRGPTKLLGELFGLGAQEADNIRLAVEHLIQGLAAFFKNKESKAAATAADTVATEANTAAQWSSTTATDANAASASTATIAAQGFATAEMEVAAATEVAATGMTAILGLLSGGLIIAFAALVTVLVIAGKAIYNIVTSSKQLREAQLAEAEAGKELIESYKKEIDALNELSQIKRRSLERELSDAEKSGQSQEKLFAIKKKIALFDKYNADVNKSTADVTEAGLNKTIKAYDKALHKVTSLNEQLKKNAENEAFNAQNHTVGNLLTGGFSPGSVKIADLPTVDGEKLQKEKELADKQLAELEARKNFEISILKSVADTKDKIRELDVEQAKFNADEQRKIILETTRFEVDLIKDKNGRTLSNERSTLSQKLSAISSNLTAEKRLIEAQKNDVLNDPSKSEADRLLAEKSASNARLIAARDFQKQKHDLNEDYRRRDLSAQLNIDKDLISEKEMFEKELSTDTNFGLQERLLYARKYYDDQKELADKQFKYDMDLAVATGRTEQEKNAIQVAYNLKLVQLNADTQRSITDILKGELEHRKKLIDDAFQDIALLTAEAGANDAEWYANETVIISKRYTSGKIGYDKYLRSLEKLDIQYAATQAKNSISSLKKQLAEYEKNYPDIEKTIVGTEKNISDAKIELDLAYANHESDQRKKELSDKIDLLKKELDEEKKTALAIANARKGISDATAAANKATAANTKKTREEIIADLVKAIEQVAAVVLVATTLIGGLINASTERQKNDLADLDERQQSNYDKNVERVNNSTLTEQQKHDTLTSLELQRQTQKTQNERKQRQLDLERARFEKAQAIASIILQGAIATVKAFGRSLFEGIAMATLTAAQLAVAIATPLPRFATGTYSSPEGFAWVGERGAEGRVNPDGTTSMTPDKPTLTWLDRGTQIIPNHKLSTWLPQIAMGNVPRYSKDTSDNGMGKFVATMTDAMSIQTIELRKLNKKKTKTVTNVNINANWGSYLDKKVYSKN